MPDQIPTICPKCGGPITGMFYGTADCGPHVTEDFKPHPAFVISLDNNVFADWEDVPDPIVILASAIPLDTKVVWVPDARCCMKRDLEPDDEGWCNACGEFYDD